MITDPDVNPEDGQSEPLDIDRDVGTVVTHPQGAVSTGFGDQFNVDDFDVAGGWVSGNQNNYNNCQVYQQVEARRRTANPQAVTEDRIVWLQDRFVRPGFFHLAEQTLAGSAATVLIAGLVGSGRQTAAQMLLCPPGSDRCSLRRLPAEPEDLSDALLDSSQVLPGDRLLLDLSEVDREMFERHQQQLPSFRDAVQRNNARLAVVLPHNQEYWLSDELWPLRVTINRPDPLRVLRMHLSGDQLPASDHELRSNELSRELLTASMSRLSRLAGFIGEAAARASGKSSNSSQWLAEALAALNNHAAAVVEALRTHSDAPARALLLSMAMLEDARVVAVDHAERDLLRITRCPETETPRLERCHLFDRIRSLDADVDGERRVRFHKLGYSSAVLTHFWDGYPGLRRQLAQWVGQLARLPQLTNEDRDHLADRFAEQSLRAGHIDDLLRTAGVWAQHRNQSARSLAYTVLATAVIDVKFGGSVRRQLYEWAWNRQLHSELARIIIVICADVLIPSYPDRALVRLRLLARHSNPGVAAEARQALIKLAADNWFFGRLLTKLIEATEFNAELFLELADPQRLTPPLIADPGIQAQVISGWQLILVDHRNPSCIALVRQWLQVYTDDPQREVLLDVLVGACEGRPDLFAHLFEINRGWQHDPTEPTDQQCRHRTASHLQCKIARARGLVFSYSRLSTTVEEANR